MAIGIEHIAPLLPADWPGIAGATKPPVMPGDLTQFIPSGFGGGVPVVMRPWDKLESVDQQQSYYGFDAPQADPVRGAPSSDSSGGCLYFNDSVATADLLTALRVVGAYEALDDYVVFGRESEDPQTDRYLDQIRIVQRGALGHLFGVPQEVWQAVPKPSAPLGELVTTFVEKQRQKWNDAEYAYSSRLAGAMGGDSDWAKESLAFGFLMENQYWQVMRIWSRAWLVTK
jgi:hypothetical protein